MTRIPVIVLGAPVSRARRAPRHRRTGRPRRIGRVAAPIAVGGAVAAVSLTAAPLRDALHHPSGTGTDRSVAGAGPGPTTLQVAPVTGAGGRAGGDPASRGEYRPSASAARSAAGSMARSGSADGRAVMAAPSPRSAS